MIERIQELIDKLNIQPSKFADEIGVPRSTISHLVSGRNKPSLDFIMKIVEKYPEVNVDWIVFGRGEAFNNVNSISEMSYIEKTAEKSIEKAIKNQPDLFSNADQSDDTSTKIETLTEVNRAETNENSENKKQHENITKSQESEENSDVEKIIILYKDKTFSEYSKR
jgi:transcriptional regulator with XRE-family HTH domain